MKINKVIVLFTLLLVGYFSPAICERNPLKPEARAASAAARRVQVVNVGITEYQKIEDSYDRYKVLFQQLTESAGANMPVTFKFAIGNYGEVLDWYNKGLIDIAVLSATPVADLLNNAGKKELDKIDKAYVGDVSVTRVPDTSKPDITDLFPNRQKPEPFTYRTGCIVLESDKDLRTIDDIKRFWQQDNIKFLFVRPYSMSGYILPREILRQHGIYPRPDQMEFTYEHQKSLTTLYKSVMNRSANEKKHLVAFVLDTTKQENIPQGTFHRIEITKLDDYRIPREIVLANYNQEKDALEAGEGYANKFQKYKDIMTTLFKNLSHRKVGGPTTAALRANGIDVSWREPSKNWRANYKPIQEAMNNVQLPRELLYRASVDDLLKDLAAEMDRPSGDPAKPKLPPRLALVLSGGGAKCAYQAGAIIEIERKLQKINSERQAKNLAPLDIGLVVGTSGGAINALLVAMGVTRDNKAPEALATMWASFRQQQFFQPSRRFNVIFGLCFGLLQALTITVAVLLFGRHSMNWVKTICVLVIIGVLETLTCRYFRLSWRSIGGVLGIEALFLLFIVAAVLIVGWIITRTQTWWRLRKPGAQSAELKTSEAPDSHADADHWRWLTIVLMLALSVGEWLIAKAPGLNDRISELANNHWVDHIWMIVTLVCNLSFPYPLAIAVLMAIIGGVIWESFDWNRRRETFVWWMAVILIAVSTGLVLEAFFRENAPSKAQGIEDAFVKQIPVLLQNTVKPDFKPLPPREGETPLESISRQLMDENAPALQRDLVITTSRLTLNLPPVLEPGNNSPEQKDAYDKQAKQAELVNGLPDDLYFYFRTNKDERLPPPPDKKFVPFKYNREKLLYVVIGSSTIYPVFPSRELRSVTLGGEEMQAPEDEQPKKISIIDGGFIHNIPIEAAGLWKASHIIVIEASPLRAPNQPRHFWDNAMMAFGYLFTQAQRSDRLARGNAETFELRPRSRCEKENTLPSCAGSENLPDPDMDTFDFSDNLVRRAFIIGEADATGCEPCQQNCDVRNFCLPGSDRENPRPLLVRVPGPPLFRTPSPPARLAEVKLGGPRGKARSHTSDRPKR